MRIFARTLIAATLFLSFGSRAAGSKKPVTDFAANYVLYSGTAIEDERDNVVSCPNFLQVRAFEAKNSRGKVVEAQLSAVSPAGVFMSFNKVNLGDVWTGRGRFEAAYTTKKGITGETGREYLEPGTPGNPPNMPGRPPERRRLIEFRYGMEQFKDKSLRIWTSSSRAECFYVLPGSR
jgi:hypothetical protein